ncbi:hypothetical protein EVAR_28379_1 [Eumeta japonica]|uniref:Uncharacterized protein n=1 Tax=Eumeta variegata TaxID=151549 RepID=A0A4C1XBA7_EUMVA|nr:hypothetical protein EVAR_28379_1 [Eumeta japonica]
MHKIKNYMFIVQEYLSLPTKKSARLSSGCKVREGKIKAFAALDAEKSAAFAPTSPKSEPRRVTESKLQAGQGEESRVKAERDRNRERDRGQIESRTEIRIERRDLNRNKEEQRYQKRDQDYDRWRDVCGSLPIAAIKGKRAPAYSKHGNSNSYTLYTAKREPASLKSVEIPV